MSKPWKIGIGCLAMALITIVVLGLVGWKVVAPKVIPKLDANIVMVVEMGILDYMANNPDSVPETGDNASWAILLKDKEIEGLKFGDLVHSGQFMNVLAVPLKIETSSTTQITIVAAGMDRKIGTEDDVDTERARTILEALDAEKPASVE